MAILIDNKTLKATPLAEGGEAVIYNYGSDMVLKVYKSGVNKNEKLMKLKALMSTKLPYNVVAPVDIANDNKGNFIGYIMPKIEGTEVRFFASKKFLKANGVSVKDITKTMMDICHIVRCLHTNKIYVGDLNDCNILFDKDYNPYFVDVDSWSVGGIDCTVAMDSFKDPNLVGTNFNADTDAYSFAVMAFKSYTRMHPFGGVMNPDIHILERMKKGLSVIDNPNITLPAVTCGWTFLNPSLVKGLKSIFNDGKRYMLEGELEHLSDNLKHCQSHGDWYYAKFDSCPICNASAKVVTAPTRVDTGTDGIPYMLLFTAADIDILLNLDSYISTGRQVVHRHTGRQIAINIARPGTKYFFSNDGEVVTEVLDDMFILHVGQGSKYTANSFEKLPKSQVMVHDKEIYFISRSGNLTKLIVDTRGNMTKPMCQAAFRNYFEVCGDSYMIVNEYENLKLATINGYNYTFKPMGLIMEWGIHFDSITSQWLFICQTKDGIFHSFVFDNKAKLLWENHDIVYNGNLSNICFHNGLIFKPVSGAIRGYSYGKNAYKDFPCPIVEDDSELSIDRTATRMRFNVVNEKSIYMVG